MSDHQTSLSSPSITGSLESVAGLSRCGSPESIHPENYGQDPAHANLSPRQAKELGLLTSGTCGRHGCGSSSSADLQSSLESKLRQSLQRLGSPLFDLTWKPWVMPWGAPLSRLRASALNSSAIGSIGLPLRLPRPSGTSNHGKNHVAGRLDEWGGSSNPFRGTPHGRTHSPHFELWVMGYPDAWARLMLRAMRSSQPRRQSSSRR